ncbi:MAG TPA: ABC transporter permease subunit [Anaerolineales bacterium]|nr:ABC transporter permease subunit [Anaerolineales bacterium]
MKKIWVLVGKEWAEVFKNRIVIFSVGFMPLIFSAIPLGILFSMRGATDMSGIMDELGPAFDQLQGLCGQLADLDCAQFLLLQQFMVLFLMMPAIIPITIAAYSIVGEKNTHTLEPLLATPITTGQLLAGKALAAVIPAVLASLAAFAIFATGAYFLAASPAVALQLFSPVWLIGIFAVGPLLSLAGVSLAVMISSRVNEPRAAEQLAVLIILPVMAIFIGQLMGAVIVNQAFLLAFAGALIIADAALMYFATRLFQRETILTRWK